MGLKAPGIFTKGIYFNTNAEYTSRREPFDEASIPMTVGELNHLMTYVTEGWMLFSIGFIGIEFVSFVSRRIQEDIEADRLALKEAQTEAVSVSEAVESAIAQKEAQAASVAEVPNTPPETSTPKSLAPEPTPAPKAEPSNRDGEAESSSEETAPEALTEEDEARLEEVAAVSEQLAKTKSKQSDSSSVSVST